VSTASQAIDPVEHRLAASLVRDLPGEAAMTLTLGRAAPTIPVRDIDAALRFYEDVLGLKKVFENGDPVGFVILEKDRAEIHLTRVKDHHAGAHNVMHMMVSDARALHDLAVAAGMRVVKGLRDQFGMRTFVVCDPDGNRIDVGEQLAGD
jgi:catechol 2,3-dioxygenase-like lactoylglutathione lyase family enzyme